MAHMRSLAQELPYAAGVAKQNKTKQNKNTFFTLIARSPFFISDAATAFYVWRSHVLLRMADHGESVL